MTKDEAVKYADQRRRDLEDIGLSDGLVLIVSEIYDIHTSFKESVYELAFGDDAINKDYTDKEVLEKLFEDLQALQKYEDA